MFNVLYLQKLYSQNANPLKGKRLFEELQRDSDDCRLGYIVREDASGVAPEHSGDVVTHEELGRLRPDVIFIEGGLLTSRDWRVPEQVLESEAWRGAVVILCDVDWNDMNAHRQEYERALDLFGASVAFDGDEPVELFDPKSFVGGERQIVVNSQDMGFESWLAPIYEDLPPFAVGTPVLLRSWSELVATCNRSSTQASHRIAGIPTEYGTPESGAFAAARRLGNGYLVFIGGNVSNDVWQRDFPGNLEFLMRLVKHFVERVRIDRRRNLKTHQVFISHRHDNAQFASRYRDELRRRGFGTWLDSRKLVVGSGLTPEIRRSIEESTHFTLIWSESCAAPDGEWIRLELEHALANSKPILIVRLDDTAVPDPLKDNLRVEAQALTPVDAARLVATNLEREKDREAPCVQG